MLRALLLTLLVAPSAAAFQWSFDEPGPHETDLVVEGTLVRADARVVLAHGAIYEEVRSTIVVHRVLYRDADAPPPGSTVELYAAQQPVNPHIFHARDAYHRGMWLLSRSRVEGVYTSYRSRSWFPVETTSRPATARLVAGDFDPTTGEAAVVVRYENYGPEPVELDEVSFDATGRPRGLGRALRLTGSSGPRDGPEVLRTPSLEPARSRLRLEPWTHRRATVHFTLPAELRGARWIWLGVPIVSPGSERRWDSASLWPRVEDERSFGDPPLWLSPGDPTRVVLAWPPAPLVALILVVGALPLALRGRLRLPGGRTLRFTRSARWLGAWTVAVCAALLPWALLRPGPLQLMGPIVAFALLLAVGLLAALSRGLRARGVQVPALRRLALVPIALLLAQLAFVRLCR